MSALADLLSNAGVINNLPTAVFSPANYHRRINKIVVTSASGGIVSVYRAALGTVPIMTINNGSSDTRECSLDWPAGQILFVQWSNINQSNITPQARLSLTSVDNFPFDDGGTGISGGSNAIDVPLIIPPGTPQGTTRVIIDGTSVNVLLGNGFQDVQGVIVGSAQVHGGLPTIEFYTNNSFSFPAVLALIDTAGGDYTFYMSDNAHRGSVTANLVEEGVFVKRLSAFLGAGWFSGVDYFPDGGNVVTSDSAVYLALQNAVSGVVEGMFSYDHSRPGLFVSNAIHAWKNNNVTTQLKEPWQAFTLLNGWTNRGAPYITAQYRMVASPANCVHIVGYVVGGTAVNGTQIFQLPIGYRPLSSVGIPMTGNIVGGITPVLDVDNTGAGLVYNVAAGASYSFDVLIPTDHL